MVSYKYELQDTMWVTQMLRDHWPAIMLLTIILFDDKVGCISLISTSSSYRDCWCFPQAMEIRWSIHYITKYMKVSLVETYSFCTKCSLTCCLIVNLCLFLKFYFKDNLAFYNLLAMVNFQLRLHALINENWLLLSHRLLSHWWSWKEFYVDFLELQLENHVGH